MRILNIIMYLFLAVCVIAIVISQKGKEKKPSWEKFLREHTYLLGLLMIINTISFVMTFIPENKEIYVEKAGYGEEETEIPFRLQKGEEQEDIFLTVSARQLTEQEVKKRVEEAFVYLGKNMKGENESLSKVITALSYELDYEQFPFDKEFVADDYHLIDEEGFVRNETEYLLSLGYTQQDIQKGIPVNITATLWYGEQSFQETFYVKIFPKERSGVEKEFAQIKELLSETEEKASYQEGFFIPAVLDEIQIIRMDKESVTPAQILMAGIILTILLLLREQENKKKALENRRKCLMYSYPWFINEMVLLLGAGMQVKNIFCLLIKDYEEESEPNLNRKPLIEEIAAAVRGMELGMPEEQAYYRLGRRLGLPCYIKIMTLLEQNVKRGGKGLTAVFEQEELHALEERKNIAKRYGEEAGTKLLGPMVILLLVVMLMIMVPAFLGFAQ